MQPVHCAMSRRVASSIPGSATMSRDREAAAGPQHPGRLAEDRGLVAGEVDHAVGDDHVDRVVRERHLLDRPLQELDVLDPGLALVSPRQLEHLVGHVDAVGLARGADPAGGEQDVDPAARAEVENGLALVELGHRGRVAAAERGELGGVGKRVLVADLVEPGAERLAATRVRDVRAATADAADVSAASAVDGPQQATRPLSTELGRGGVALAHRLANLVLVGQLSHPLSSSSASGLT